MQKGKMQEEPLLAPSSSFARHRNGHRFLGGWGGRKGKEGEMCMKLTSITFFL